MDRRRDKGLCLAGAYEEGTTPLSRLRRQLPWKGEPGNDGADPELRLDPSPLCPIPKQGGAPVTVAPLSGVERPENSPVDLPSPLGKH